MAMSRRGAIAIAVIAAATTVLLAVLWAVAIPLLLGLPAALWRDNLIVSVGMAVMVLVVTGVVNALFRIRWRQRRPAELPMRQLATVLFGCFVAVGVAWGAALHRLPTPYGIALTAAHFGAGVLVSLLSMGLALPLLRSETVRQVSGPGAAGKTSPQSWSRVGLRGYLLLVVVLLGTGATCLVVSFQHVRTHRESLDQRARSAVILLELMARRVEMVPRSRFVGTVGRARLPAGTVLRVVSRKGHFFGGDEAEKAAVGGTPTAKAPIRLRAARRCGAARLHASACRWTALRPPHDELALVALLWPTRPRHSGHAPWVLLLFAVVLTLFAALVAFFMGLDVSNELDEVALRVRSMAERPEQGLGEPLYPTSSDEMGELLERFGELRQTLDGQLAVSARDVHRSAAEDREKTAYLEEVNFALRTPLTAVIGFAELLAEGAYGAVTPDQAQELQITRDSSQQLLGLVQDIVDVSFAEAGGIRLRLEEADLGALLRSELAAAGAAKEDDAVLLRLVAPEDLPPVVLDPRRVRRVVANLLSNALKFTSAGEVVVTVSDPARGRIEIGVRDTGMGIAPEHQALIFEQYRQAPQSRPRELRGSGLGLAIVQQLVRLHGGRVWLESTPGEGSEFFISLPLRGPESVADDSAGKEVGGA